MKKTTFLLVIFVLVASMFLMAASPSGAALATLTIRNRTGDNVNLRLTGDRTYYLTAEPGWNYFTVQRDIYGARYWACETTGTGAINLITNVRLNFQCNRVPNLGEPTMEKIAIRSPQGLMGDPPGYWRFQY